MDERIVKVTTIKGIFSYPMGFNFYGRKIGDHPKNVLVSTVQLDGGHLEDALGICEAESGFETAVFLAGYTSTSIYSRHYHSKRAAKVGHDSVVESILSGKLTLAIPVQYSAWDQLDGDRSEHAESIERERARRSHSFSLLAGGSKGEPR
jgi:hypothetical protein